MNDLIKVLIVDDSAVVRDFLSYVISSEEGMQVVGAAKNGQEAIELTKSRKPDLITMDISMPVMNGLEATKIIKERWPRVKVIALTIYKSYQSKAISAEADAFLVKGCSLTELVSTVQSLAQGI